VWLEVSSQVDASPSPATQAYLADWQASGWSVRSAVVRGPAFWQTTDIEDAPALVLATRRLLADHDAVTADRPTATAAPRP